MKSIVFLLFAMSSLCLACQTVKSSQAAPVPVQAYGDIPSPDTIKKSIPREAHAVVGGVQVDIQYHAPAVRGRVIWGGLVPYDEVWVTGAHSATNISFSKDVRINGIIIPKGKYGFFTIPGKASWILILNKNWDQHLTDEYNPGEDLVRVNVVPVTGLPLVERLTYRIEERDNGQGAVIMQWETLSVALDFRAK